MEKIKEKIRIALLGCGTVGSSVAKILTAQKDILKARHKVELELAYIVDIDFTRAEALDIDKGLFCSDIEKVLGDDSVEIVVELIGGTAIARDFMERSIKAGKKIVTANKALLAQHGNELLALARAHGVCIAFEASCAGGIPVIRALLDGLIANRIDAIYGIVNGTSNYILTAMTIDSLPYTTALKEAQDAGLAEADPTLDVEGIDSGHKLAIMASLAFGKRIDFKKIPVEGIHTLDICDIEYGKELGYVIKLLAIAQRRDKGICVYVRPAFISMEHPLAWVSGPFNAVSVYGHANGHTMYYGRGAGGDPTASAVISDIYQAATGITSTLFTTLNLWPDEAENAIQLSSKDFKSRYYIRLTLEDKPGVLAQIAEKFGKNNISISSVLQQELHPDSDIHDGVPVIITTHPAMEGSVLTALKEVDKLDATKSKSVCIAILDEHVEKI
ncbi:MAG: homoserine dehydrogenase [Spirochaetales bacterium]|nr:homoserine dehydrogenase [Spirochaetales bacterium]